MHTVVQDYPHTAVADRTIQYRYDLHSGKVNEVRYQADRPDRFTHRYAYDALNRLLRVQTSANDVVWETDAEYF